MFPCLCFSFVHPISKHRVRPFESLYLRGFFSRTVCLREEDPVLRDSQFTGEPQARRGDKIVFSKKRKGSYGASQESWVSSEEVSRPNNATDTDGHPTGTSQLK